MNGLKVVKLNKRYKGNVYFTHRIEVTNDIFRVYWVQLRSKMFVNLRNWFISNFGNGIELDLLQITADFEPKPIWAYDTGTKNNRVFHIYLNERELSWFLLCEEQIAHQLKKYQQS